MTKRPEWKKLIVSILIPLAVGGAAALIANGSFKDFEALNKPPLAPPAWAFPAAWTLLYILMGIAAYLVYCSEKYPGRIERALTFYAVQLFMNFCWTLIFFNLKLYLAAFIWLVLLWAAIAGTVCGQQVLFGTALLFRFISKPAGWLMLPYLAWVTFAGYLNLGVYILNR